jgi:50S ribosomal protein L16 3-hydroxylase
MLGAWLGSLPVETFVAQHLQRGPIARPGTATTALPLLDWEVLAQVLAHEDPRPDVLVVAGGKLLPWPAPRDLTELRVYLRMGVGLAMRHTQHCHPNLRRVADAFETDVGQAQVQIFVTPASAHGFSWHYDDEDVFIAQTLGAKDYYFRANTVCPEVTAHGTVFGRFAEETSPIHTATLIAGDFLYIPARWWHMATCREEALSISVGVYPRSGGGPEEDARIGTT